MCTFVVILFEDVMDVEPEQSKNKKDTYQSKVKKTKKTKKPKALEPEGFVYGLLVNDFPNSSK